MISAYLVGLFRDPKGSPAADYRRSRHHHHHLRHHHHHHHHHYRPSQDSNTSCRSSTVRAKPPPGRSSHLLPFEPVVGSQVLPSALRSSPPVTPPNHPHPAAIAAATTAPITASSTYFSTPGSPRRWPSSTGRGWRYFSRGEEQREDRTRQHPPPVVYSGAYLGEEDRVPISSAGRPGPWPARPATAPSGATTAVTRVMNMTPTGRGVTAPVGYSTATPDQGYGGRGGGDADQYSPHEESDCFNSESFAAAGSCVPGTAACRRRQHLPYQQHQRGHLLAGPPRHHAADVREQNNHDPFLVCRGWRKASKNPRNEFSAPSLQAEPAGSPTEAVPLSPSPQESSPGFGECRGSFGSSCRPLEPETLPRNMFLTTTHRRGGDALAPRA